MNEANEPALLPKIEAAFQLAARDVVSVAKQTGTPVIVWKDGRVHEIPCDRLDELLPPEKIGKPVS